MSAWARVGGILVQVEHSVAVASSVRCSWSETLVMKFDEMRDSLWLEVGKPDLRRKKRKKAINTPRRRNLRLANGWGLGLIFWLS